MPFPSTSESKLSMKKSQLLKGRKQQPTAQPSGQPNTTECQSTKPYSQVRILSPWSWKKLFSQGQKLKGSNSAAASTSNVPTHNTEESTTTSSRLAPPPLSRLSIVTKKDAFLPTPSQPVDIPPSPRSPITPSRTASELLTAQQFARALGIQIKSDDEEEEEEKPCCDDVAGVEVAAAGGVTIEVQPPECDNSGLPASPQSTINSLHSLYYATHHSGGRMLCRARKNSVATVMDMSLFVPPGQERQIPKKSSPPSSIKERDQAQQEEERPDNGPKMTSSSSIAPSSRKSSVSSSYSSFGRRGSSAYNNLASDACSTRSMVTMDSGCYIPNTSITSITPPASLESRASYFPPQLTSSAPSSPVTRPRASSVSGSLYPSRSTLSVSSGYSSSPSFCSAKLFGDDETGAASQYENTQVRIATKGRFTIIREPSSQYNARVRRPSVASHSLPHKPSRFEVVQESDSEESDADCRSEETSESAATTTNNDTITPQSAPAVVEVTSA
ncbi:hypothetical protein HK102_004620 [Quaeritorhiza haematococci]|nr:hypothetical protein HK102_004620 [Quaeritorhiza haematococci]